VAPEHAGIVALLRGVIAGAGMSTPAPERLDDNLRLALLERAIEDGVVRYSAGTARKR
jgi:hypothetical protein